MHAYFDLRLWDSVPQCSLHRWLCTLQGMTDSIGSSNLFRACSWFLRAQYLLDREKRCSPTFWLCRASVSRWLFVFAELLVTVLTHFLTRICQALMLHELLSAALRTTYVRLEVFHSMLWTAWNQRKVQISFGRHQRSNNLLHGFPATHPR